MESKSQVLNSIRRFYPDYHPLVAIAHIAHDSVSDPRLKFDCHRVIAKYVEPELKSLEVRGTFTETRRVSVSLFDESEITDAVLIEPARLVDQAIDAY
jgi:hypothetical protein